LPLAGEPTVPRGLVLAVGADQVRAEAGADEILEVLAGEAFVAGDDLHGADQAGMVAVDGRLVQGFPWSGRAPRSSSSRVIAGLLTVTVPCRADR
jgi:hypothetical protein